MSETQADRRVALKTPLGDDVLLLQSLQGVEELGRLFSFSLELVSSDAQIDFNEIIGQNVTVRLDADDSSERFFNGYVSRFIQNETTGDFASYQATVVPWFWFLTRVSDCRIFQEKTVPDIIKEVFDSRGFDQFELRLSRSFVTREYCVQYRETDFNFVSRLMEQEGIYYYFVHEDGQHTMVLVDAPSAHDSCPGAADVTYYPWNLGSDFHGIRNWVKQAQVDTGMFAHTDYNFKTPGANLLADKADPKEHDHADYEIFDYPGEYENRGDGQDYSEVRLQELQARQQSYSGVGDIRKLYPGHTFTLDGYFREEDNQKYLVTSIQHTIHSNEFEAVRASRARFYQANVTSIPANVPFRTERITRRPIVSGPQSALVTGPSGEEIHTDEFGRIKVHFYWDRHDDRDDKSSCWMRVSQAWAGKNWGFIAIPRIGHEVIVEFLEGDPDRPIVTGSVYNGENGVPYDLPANKTQTGLKSRSSKGGSTDNFNEIRFEDKIGEEQVYVHAEKNQDNIVENDETTSVGHDRTENVGNDETITIGNDRTEKVGNNETISIGNDRAEDVGNNETIAIAVDRTETVGSNETITVGSNRTLTVNANEVKTVIVTRTHSVGVNEMISVGAAQQTNVGGMQSNTIGINQDNSVGANQSTDVGSNQSNTIGSSQSNTIGEDQSTSVGKDRNVSVAENDSLDVGKILTMTAADEIVLKTGKASILMKKDGTIQIKGKDISVDGSGKIEIKASKDVIVKGKKILEN